ncbi:Kinesin-like protein KIN-5C, partial [Aduncisulcus paluster]
MKQSKVNIQVVVRVRPTSSPATKSLGYCNGEREIMYKRHTPIAGKETYKQYYFDKVYHPTSTQEEVYKGTVSPIIKQFLNGFSCTVFAYGPTGTGKTYTMEGPSGPSGSEKTTEITAESGMIPRAIHEIFTTLEKSKSDYTVKISHLEVYKEELYDLLAGKKQTLRLLTRRSKRKGATDKIEAVVHGLQEFTVTNSSEVLDHLRKSSHERSVAETFSNRASSRSHCIFTITTLIKETTRDGQELLKTAKLHLVDLAGSEGADACIGKDGKVNYQRKAESTKINLSLLTLGSVIRNIAEGNPHVPYLDSNLTKLLSESLGGRTFTCLIATVSLDAGSKEATKSTLQYAQMAKTIKNTPEQNERMTKKLV